MMDHKENSNQQHQDTVNLSSQSHPQPFKITNFKRQNLKPPVRHDSSTNILIFTPNKRLSFIEDYIKSKLYSSQGNINNEILKEEIKLVRCNKVDSLHTVLTSQIKENKLMRNSEQQVFRRNICISDQEINQEILNIFIKVIGMNPYSSPTTPLEVKSEQFSYVLFADKIEDISYKNFHAQEGVQLITSQPNKIIQYFDQVCQDIVAIRQGGEGRQGRQLSAGISTSTINSKDQEQLHAKFNKQLDVNMAKKSLNPSTHLEREGIMKNGSWREEGETLYVEKDGSPGIGAYNIEKSPGKSFGDSGVKHAFGHDKNRSDPQKWGNSDTNFSGVKLSKSRGQMHE